MKRYGNLWPQLVSFENLLRAAFKARRGKRFRPSVANFEFGLEVELWRLHDELVGCSYRPGPYRSFRIFEPKERLISAAPYRDRIVHHALTSVLERTISRATTTTILVSFRPELCGRQMACHTGIRRLSFGAFCGACACKIQVVVPRRVVHNPTARPNQQPARQVW